MTEELSPPQDFHYHEKPTGEIQSDIVVMLPVSSQDLEVELKDEGFREHTRGQADTSQLDTTETLSRGDGHRFRAGGNHNGNMLTLKLNLSKTPPEYRQSHKPNPSC